MLYFLTIEIKEEKGKDYSLISVTAYTLVFLL